MNNIETINLTDAKACRAVINENTGYGLFWRSGYAYRGAKEKSVGCVADLERGFAWAAAIDIEVDHCKKEIHLNGFSCNDLY